jgi:hypothetical protein
MDIPMLSSREGYNAEGTLIETVQMKERNMLIGEGGELCGVGRVERYMDKAHYVRKKIRRMARHT